MEKLFKRTNVAKRTRTYVGTVKVTPENMTRFNNFRQAMKELGRTVTMRGRNPNRKHVAHCTGQIPEKLRQDIPIKWATSFDVYWRS